MGKTRDITKEAIVATINEEDSEESRGANDIFDNGEMKHLKHRELAANLLAKKKD